MGSKSPLLPYLQRADEVAKANPKVAYYCRLYAVDEGMKLLVRDKDTNALLGAVLKQLEQDKPKLQLGAVADDCELCTQFALKIFHKAETQDREGRATAATAKAYYAATVFLEVTRQFGEMDSECAAKQKFAAWRAAEVRAACKEGRAPAPLQPVVDTALDDSALERELEMLERDLHTDVGLTGTAPQAAVEAEAPRWQPEWGKPTAYQVGDMALFWNQDGSTSVGKVMQVDMLARPPMFVVEVDGARQSTDLGRLAPAPRPPPPAPLPAPSFAPTYPSPTELESHPVFAPPPQPLPVSRLVAPTMPPPTTRAAQAGFTPGVKAVGEAQKAAKYAASSLQFDDVASGITYLQTALKLLTQPS